MCLLFLQPGAHRRGYTGGGGGGRGSGGEPIQTGGRDPSE